MEISRGLFSVIVILALFAGTGAIHLAQMTGLINIAITVTPTTLAAPAAPEWTPSKGSRN